MSYPRIIESKSGDMYVVDLISEVIRVRKGGFNLFKRHSNISSLENTKRTASNELTLPKQMFLTSSNETKKLDIPWNKLTDKLSTSIPKFEKRITKRNIFSYLVSTYNLLGIISRCHILGKVMYNELCDGKFREIQKLLSILKKL